MTRAAHPANPTVTPACPHCWRWMQPTPAGHHTCTHDDTEVAAYDLPRGDDTATPNHVARVSSGPFALPPDRGPRLIHHQGSTRGRKRK